MSGAQEGIDQPLRYACDKCHAQKIRCLRSNEAAKANSNEPCSRCRQAGVACTVSLRGKVGRPSKGVKKRPRQAFQTYQSSQAELPVFDTGAVFDSSDSEMEQLWTSSTRHGLNDLSSRQTDSRPVKLTSDTVNIFDPEKSSCMPSTGCFSAPGHFTRDSPASRTVPYKPFTMDFDPELDVPAFYVPNDVANTLESTPNVMGHLGNTDHLGDALQDSAPAFASKDMMECSAAANDIFYATEKPSLVSPVHPFCNALSYQKLSDLNDRVLLTTMNIGAVFNKAEMLKEVTNFSGEMIHAAREVLPYISISSPFSIGTTSASVMNRATELKESERSGKIGEWKNDAAVTRDQPVPGSAVIFLLLGCYTQLLHLFEITVSNICDQLYHVHDPKIEDENKNSTVVVSLEASLAVHTITYLLRQLQTALSVKEDPENVQESGNIGGYSELKDWKRHPKENKHLNGGVLNWAFGEIMEREQRLFRRTQQLQETINKHLSTRGGVQ